MFRKYSWVVKRFIHHYNIVYSKRLQILFYKWFIIYVTFSSEYNTYNFIFHVNNKLINLHYTLKVFDYFH